MIWVRRETKSFCEQGWTGQIKLIRFRNFRSARSSAKPGSAGQTSTNLTPSFKASHVHGRTINPQRAVAEPRPELLPLSGNSGQAGLAAGSTKSRMDPERNSFF